MPYWFEQVAFIIVFIIIGSFAYGSLRAAPWLPTRGADLERLFSLLRKHGKKGGRFVDLGCGDGRVIFEAAKRGYAVTGYEVGFPCVWYMWVRKCFFPSEVRKRVTVHCRDFWNVDLSDADVVYFFLTPKIYPKMKKKLQKELKKGALVVAYVWPFEDWKPLEVDGGGGNSLIYVYKV